MSRRRPPSAEVARLSRIPVSWLVGLCVMAVTAATFGLVSSAGAQERGAGRHAGRAAYATGETVVSHKGGPSLTKRPLKVVDHAASGLVYQGLVQDSECKGSVGIQGDTSATPCSHGPDPAPAGVDVTKVPSVDQLEQRAQDVAEAEVAGTISGTSTSGSSGQVPCYGTGSDGKRVEAIYAVASDRTDRFGTVAPLIAGYAANADKAFADSAKATGGIRHLRWLTTPDCKLVVDHVVLSTTGDDSFGNTKSELRALGFTRSDRKYLVWTDAGVYCGISNVVGDDTPGLTNKNNVGPTFGRVDAGCWGQSASVEAHEISHMLGSVQLSAPHSNGAWHCTDEYDRMCYNDGSGATLTYPCASSNEYTFDCGKDDYFNTSPPANSYLATHWNTANSEFLATVDGSYSTSSPIATASPTATSSPSPTSSPTATSSPSPTPTTSTLTGSTQLASWTGYLAAGRSRKLGFTVPTAGQVTVQLTDSTATTARSFKLASGSTTVGSASGLPTATWSGDLAAGKYTISIRGEMSYAIVVTLAGDSTTGSITSSPTPTATTQQLASWSGYLDPSRSRKLAFTVPTSGQVTVQLTDDTATTTRSFKVSNSSGVQVGSGSGLPTASWTGALSPDTYSISIRGEMTYAITVTLAT